jgi:hypothetical protein
MIEDDQELGTFKARFMERLTEEHPELYRQKVESGTDFEDPMMRAAIWAIMNVVDAQKAALEAKANIVE